RADIWAFGAVLHEMLTGRRLFKGDDASETLASVIKEEPTWDGIPLPAQRLLRRCLEKDPRKRLRDIGDAKIEINELIAGRESSGPVEVLRRRSAPRVLVAAALLLSAVTGITGWITRGRQRGTDRPAHFSLAPPAGATVPVWNGSVSPDGDRIVF